MNLQGHNQEEGWPRLVPHRVLVNLERNHKRPMGETEIPTRDCLPTRGKRERKLGGSIVFRKKKTKGPRVRLRCKHLRANRRKSQFLQGGGGRISSPQKKNPHPDHSTGLRGKKPQTLRFVTRGRPSQRKIGWVRSERDCSPRAPNQMRWFDVRSLCQEKKDGLGWKSQIKNRCTMEQMWGGEEEKKRDRNSSVGGGNQDKKFSRSQPFVFFPIMVTHPCLSRRRGTIMF